MRTAGGEKDFSEQLAHRSAGLPRWIRDLHLHAGLFFSPFVLMFAVSVFPPVHPMLRMGRTDVAVERSVSDVPLPANFEAGV
jgi:hypothetical protein